MASSLEDEFGGLSIGATGSTQGPAGPGAGAGFEWAPGRDVGTGGQVVLASRPGFGTFGTPIQIVVNAYEVIPTEMTVYQLDVKINRVDGRTSEGANAEDDRRPARVTYSRDVDLAPLAAFTHSDRTITFSDVNAALQALNIAIQDGAMATNPSRRDSFFLGPGLPMSQGVELWRGVYSSLRPSIDRLFVNVDLTSQVMIRPGNLVQFLLEHGRSQRPPIVAGDLDTSNGVSDRFRAFGGKMARLLKGLRITLVVPNAQEVNPKRKIRELVGTSARQATFELQDGTTMSVERWFQVHYGIRLAHPDFPCVRVTKHALYPIELCAIDFGQKFAGKLSSAQTLEVLRHTTVSPRDRAGMLQFGVGELKAANGSVLGEWGIDISPDPMELTARILPSPVVKYQQPLSVLNGVWNLRNVRLAQPAALNTWIVFVFQNEHMLPRHAVESSVNGLVSALRTLGAAVHMPQPEIVYVPADVRPADVGTYFRWVFSQREGPPPELLLCFLAYKPTPHYAAIKRFGDIEFGVATQCVYIPKLARADAQYWSNVSLKINVKLGGSNSTVDLGEAISRPTIIFGADVHHGPPRSPAPSIAAVVSTTNEDATDYRSSISIQDSREELILDLEEMVHGQLLDFQRNVGIKPERFVFFRDGVSEGQFAQVLSEEVPAIKRACTRIENDFAPDLTYIVCGKRHHLSMAPKNANEGDRRGNAPSGTTLDSGVTSPVYFDFYCQSHAGLLGTSRSAHYTVLLDENHFSADVLQELVYKLCYTYQRCTRAVSIATPAYYADLLCSRAALLLDVEHDDSASSLSSGELQNRARASLDFYRQRLPEINVDQANKLFFL
ncbi:hypothetical protein JCM10212_004211 [Sporobolomyces blumeae]